MHTFTIQLRPAAPAKFNVSRREHSVARSGKHSRAADALGREKVDRQWGPNMAVGRLAVYADKAHLSRRAVQFAGV